MTDLRRVTVAADGVAAWADGLSVTLPADVVARLGGAGGDDRLRLPASAAVELADAERLRDVASFVETPPTSTRLPVSYQRFPQWVRTAVGDVIGRVQRRRTTAWAQFPGWPLDLSADVLADLAGNVSPFAGRPTPVLLTHDLDTPEGLRNVVDHFLDVAERHGARTANYVVPCSWQIDHGLLGDVAARGHEIGIHGYDHSNRTPFAPDTERRRRLDAAHELAERYSAVGYRAPSLVRTRALLEDLAPRYRYDSSIPTSGGLFPVPNNGCASARPFVVAGITEVPVTLPRDGSLRFLGYRPQEILQTWLQCADLIAASGGVVNLLTHCERRFSGNPEMLAVYAEFVARIADDERFRFTVPAALLDEGDMS